MRKLLVANWKMNPKTTANAVRLARAIDHRGAVVCPPFPFLADVGRTLRHARLGAQDMFWDEKGAFTGEVSAPMLRAVGAEYVIVGHSERRILLGETDAMVSHKARAALARGLRVILCVGEPWGVRRNGLEAAKRHVGGQLSRGLSGVRSAARDRRTKRLFIAYEPVWAIGTGKPDVPYASGLMATFIKRTVAFACRIADVPVLYGGSLQARNAMSFLSRPELDGALVGGASLKPKEFTQIVLTASEAGARVP